MPSGCWHGVRSVRLHGGTQSRAKADRRNGGTPQPSGRPDPSDVRAFLRAAFNRLAMRDAR